jgi:hypothetical protein
VARLDAKNHGYFYLWERCDSLLRTPQLRRSARCSAGALAPILNVRGHSKSSCEVYFGSDSGCLPGESAGTKRKICTTRYRPDIRPRNPGDRPHDQPHPRKCLGFKTPFQALIAELGKDVQIRFS